ncbi:MAG: hypothetical protein HEEMFOPI_01885 [Holosporales bacterium]
MLHRLDQNRERWDSFLGNRANKGGRKLKLVDCESRLPVKEMDRTLLSSGK